MDGTRPIKFIKDGNGIQLVEISIRDRTDTNIPIRVPHDLYQNVVNMVDRSASTEQCRAELQRIIEGQFKLSKQLNGERNYNSTRAITYQKRQKAAKQSATDEEGHSDNSLNSTTSPTCLTASLDHGKISSTKKSRKIAASFLYFASHETRLCCYLGPPISAQLWWGLSAMHASMPRQRLLTYWALFKQ